MNIKIFDCGAINWGSSKSVVYPSSGYTYHSNFKSGNVSTSFNKPDPGKESIFSELIQPLISIPTTAINNQYFFLTIPLTTNNFPSLPPPSITIGGIKNIGITYKVYGTKNNDKTLYQSNNYIKNVKLGYVIPNMATNYDTSIKEIISIENVQSNKTGIPEDDNTKVISLKSHNTYINEKIRFKKMVQNEEVENIGVGFQFSVDTSSTGTLNLLHITDLSVIIEWDDIKVTFKDTRFGDRDIYNSWTYIPIVPGSSSPRPIEGKIAVGWKSSYDGMEYRAVERQEFFNYPFPKEDCVLTPIYEPKRCEITVKSNGGGTIVLETLEKEFYSDTSVTKILDYGEKYSLRIFHDDEHSFVNWSDNNTLDYRENLIATDDIEHIALFIPGKKQWAFVGKKQLEDIYIGYKKFSQAYYGFDT